MTKGRYRCHRPCCTPPNWIRIYNLGESYYSFVKSFCPAKVTLSSILAKCVVYFRKSVHAMTARPAMPAPVARRRGTCGRGQRTDAPRQCRMAYDPRRQNIVCYPVWHTMFRPTGSDLFCSKMRDCGKRGKVKPLRWRASPPQRPACPGRGPVAHASHKRLTTVEIRSSMLFLYDVSASRARRLAMTMQTVSARCPSNAASPATAELSIS